MIRDWFDGIARGVASLNPFGTQPTSIKCVAKGDALVALAADRDAIAGDWQAVGDDLRGALSSIDRTLSPVERDRMLQKATRQYVDGHITMDEFQDAQRRYGTDWESVLRSLSKRQRNP